jgi:UDP-glucose 4-epimerase
MTWLVTGGAGYIGSHVVEAFLEADIPVVVIDDLSTGHREFVPAGVPFIEGTILDTELLAKTMVDHAVTGVMAIAGFKYAGVSVQEPLHTYDQNVAGMVSVLRAMESANVDRIVFSSSAATYGTPETEIVTEESPTRPESPYGESKLIGEWLLRNQAAARALKHTSLRYFNVVGSAKPHLYDTSPHNLFPIVIEALLAGKTPRINGDDYATPDGTCVRDYVHVGDLAISHVAAARLLDEGTSPEPVYNLGSGTGLSVREIMESMAKGTGIDFTPTIAPRRPGDPARIVASGELAARDLDWSMRYTVDEMVVSAWQARTAATAG